MNETVLTQIGDEVGTNIWTESQGACDFELYDTGSGLSLGSDHGCHVELDVDKAKRLRDTLSTWLREQSERQCGVWWTASIHCQRPIGHAGVHRATSNSRQVQWG